MSLLLLFRSLTYAQRGERALRRFGISVSLIKAPQETTDRGCAYALSIRERDLLRAEEALRSAGIHYDRMFRRGGSGAWEELAL